MSQGRELGPGFVFCNDYPAAGHAKARSRVDRPPASRQLFPEKALIIDIGAVNPKASRIIAEDISPAAIFAAIMKTNQWGFVSARNR